MTLLEVFNLALARIGYTEFLTDSSDITSVAGRMCNEVYPAVRDAILRDFPWRFAKKRMTLVDSTVTVPDDWGYAYDVPEDCVKLRRIMTPGNRTPRVEDFTPFEIALGDASGTDKLAIFTDMEDADLIYTSKIPCYTITVTPVSQTLELDYVYDAGYGDYQWVPATSPSYLTFAVKIDRYNGHVIPIQITAYASTFNTGDAVFSLEMDGVDVSGDDPKVLADAPDSFNLVFGFQASGAYGDSITGWDLGISELLGSDGVEEDVKSNAYGIVITGDEVGAAFSIDPTIGIEGQTVTFTDLSVGYPTAWAWDFGDGGTSTLQNPTHEYESIDTFTVTLTASNADTTDTVSHDLDVVTDLPYWMKRITPNIIGDWLYVLYVKNSDPSKTVEIRRRDLSKPNDPTFEVYCTATTIQTYLTLRDCQLFVDGTDIYVSTVTERDAYLKPSTIKLFHLDSVVAGAGVFTETSTRTRASTSYIIGGSNPTHVVNLSADYFNYSSGHYDGTETVVTTFIDPYTYTDYETGVCTMLIVPYFVGGTTSETDIIVNERANFRLGERTIPDYGIGCNLVYQLYSGTITTPYSSASYVEPTQISLCVDYNPPNEPPWPTLPFSTKADPLLNGETISYNTLNHFPLESAPTKNVKQLVHGTMDCYTDVAATVGLENPTSSYVFVGDAAGNVTPFSGSFSMGGTDDLQGVWGTNGEILVYKSSSSDTYNYSYWTYLYAVRDTDTSAVHKYSVWSLVLADGQIAHVEGLETDTPALWYDDTLIKYFSV